jgi:nucleotide-binding universal stress UspA family protein
MSSTTTTTTTTATNLFSLDSQIRYEKILVPHDGSEMSDKALIHAAYLAKISGAEIVLLNVIEHEVIPSSTLLTFVKSDLPIEQAKQDLRNALEERIKQMLDERIRPCKDAGISKISYKIRTGKIVDEIVHQSEEMDSDIIIMASSRITSYVRVLGSIVRKVMDSIRKPVLLIHE